MGLKCDNCGATETTSWFRLSKESQRGYPPGIKWVCSACYRPNRPPPKVRSQQAVAALTDSKTGKETYVDSQGNEVADCPYGPDDPHGWKYTGKKKDRKIFPMGSDR